MFYKIGIVSAVISLSLGVFSFNPSLKDSSPRDNGESFHTIKPKRVFRNLHVVNDKLYRSEQPRTVGMVYLRDQNFQTIINLREKQRDAKLAKGLNFTMIHYPIVTWRVNETDILNVMGILKTAKGKVLIHCKHGSDRTGCMVAAYRIIFEDWSKEKALEELRKEEFGYHEFWFPDIAELIENLDVEKIRIDLGIS